MRPLMGGWKKEYQGREGKGGPGGEGERKKGKTTRTCE